MVDALQIASAAAGFGPSMALLYFTLKDYTYPKVEKPFFDDRKVFAFFALGIVLGMVLFAVESFGQESSSEETVVAVVLVFAVFEELLKLIILNFPRFQKKVDTAFYGLSMGLGMAATFTFASVYASLLDLDTATTNPTAIEILAFSLLGVQFVLLHGATTSMIGIGVARGQIRGYFTQALLLHISYSLLMIPYFVSSEFVLQMAGAVLASAVIIYGYIRMHTLLLPILVRDAKRWMPKPDKKKTHAD
jgi:RsiW-degrading membrane proteinase PrsW (M82 family)